MGESLQQESLVLYGNLQNKIKFKISFWPSLLADASYVGVSVAILEVHLAGEEHGQVVAEAVAVPVAVDHLRQERRP